MIKNEIRPLTGIRGIAAFWVVCYHFQPDILRLFPGAGVFERLFNRGGIGVDIFFVLSGFIMASVYKIDEVPMTATSYKSFLVNRIARIYPNYLFCFLLLGLMISLDHSIHKSMTDLVNYPISSAGWHIAMLQAWPFVPAKWSNWNAPGWSVSAEWFAYLFVFPFMAWLARSDLIKRVSAPAAIALLIGFAVCKQRGQLGGFTFVCMIACEFGSGCLIYLFSAQRRHLGRALEVRVDWLAGLLVGIAALLRESTLTDVIILAMIPWIIFGLSRESGWSAKVLSTPGVCYLGRLSYALYLVHAISQRLLHVFLPIHRVVSEGMVVRALTLMVYFGVPLLMAAGIYHLIEEPARVFLRRRFGAGPRQTPALSSNRSYETMR